MYFYLFDAFLREKKYESTIARIEGRLLDLGLSGKSEKLTILKSMKEVVGSAIRRGAETIVVVGDDRTLSKVISIIADQDVVIGYIPLGDKLRVAKALGIPSGAKACDILSGRIIQRLDLGRVNTLYFLSFLELEAGRELLIECDTSFHVETPTPLHTVTIYNFGFRSSDPRDGVLEMVLDGPGTSDRRSWLGGKNGAESIFRVRKVKVKSLGGILVGHADGQTVVKTPFTAEVVPKKIRVIVGKDRSFS